MNKFFVKITEEQIELSFLATSISDGLQVNSGIRLKVYRTPMPKLQENTYYLRQRTHSHHKKPVIISTNSSLDAQKKIKRQKGAFIRMIKQFKKN